VCSLASSKQNIIWTGRGFNCDEEYPNRTACEPTISRHALKRHRFMSNQAELLVQIRDVLLEALQIIPLFVMGRY
jgi:hypothetical protein